MRLYLQLNGPEPYEILYSIMHIGVKPLKDGYRREPVLNFKKNKFVTIDESI